MTIGNQKPARHRVEYTQWEIDYILSLIPTHANVEFLSRSLERSTGAMELIYHKAYSGKWLKSRLNELGVNQRNITRKIGEAKRKIGIIIGHEPK